MKTTLKNTISSMLKGRTASALITVVAMMLSSHAGAEVSQAPLSLSVGVPPNIIFTLDESGSMSWGYVPDAGTEAFKQNIGRNATRTTASAQRRYHAANTNPLAYNPNVIYLIPPSYDKSGNAFKLTTSFTSAPVNGFKPTVDKINLSNSYRPIHTHRFPHTPYEAGSHPYSSYMWNEPNPHGSTNGGERAYYYEFDHGKSGCNINASDAGGEACYTYKRVSKNSAYDEDGNRLLHSSPDIPNEERGYPRPPNNDGKYIDGEHNYAIWFSFYRSRALATLSAASIAFDGLSSNVRFTWQDLATCRTFKSNDSDSEICGSNSIKPYGKTHKGEFYTWLRNRYFNVGTPLPAAMQRVGEYLKNNDEPWLQDTTAPKGVNNPMYGCRANYHVLMTDGMWNTKYETRQTKNSRGNWSHAYNHRITFPTTNTDDNLGPPYGDKTKETLADMAMHYWATDLRPDLENSVPKHIVKPSDDDSEQYNNPRNNPADWQHMTNFILGLGLTNALNDPKIPWEGSTHRGKGFEALMAGKIGWPEAGGEPPRGSNEIQNANNVYDLWHAAINSRGEFYSVD